MAASKVNRQENIDKESQSTTVKGTIFSVTVVGVVIFITYLIIYGLYMARV
ncbi:cytochrome c oxidase subunit 2A [Bacillus niameyensis]|uniref:cytochrome c oxidase subunit 2A n=1 Tax=Bacillus niameyensis TaxID=1522308 RepID=UPI000A59C288|nr:cytochrome c oxidase subunit 2A [Bacillus niameyensis]